MWAQDLSRNQGDSVAKLKETDMSLNPYFAADLLCDLEQFVVFHLLICVQLFATPWTAAWQASLSFAISKFAHSCPLSQWCHPTISCSVVPFFSCPQSFPASGSWWRVLTKCGLLENKIANHFSILTSRTPWMQWKGSGDKLGAWN